jgi:uncharacterized protein
MDATIISRLKGPSSLERLRAVEEIEFVGHPMVSAMHERTMEVTKERHLTPQGDCIIGVGASKGTAQLSVSVKEALRSDGARVRLTLVTPAGDFAFTARGSKDLSFQDPNDIVIRKSDYVCGRTLAIHASASARKIPRELVKSLRSAGATGILRIEVLA